MLIDNCIQFSTCVTVADVCRFFLAPYDREFKKITRIDLQLQEIILFTEKWNFNPGQFHLSRGAHSTNDCFSFSSVTLYLLWLLEMLSGEEAKVFACGMGERENVGFPLSRHLILFTAASCMSLTICSCRFRDSTTWKLER